MRQQMMSLNLHTLEEYSAELPKYKNENGQTVPVSRSLTHQRHGTTQPLQSLTSKGQVLANRCQLTAAILALPLNSRPPRGSQTYSSHRLHRTSFKLAS